MTFLIVEMLNPIQIIHMALIVTAFVVIDGGWINPDVSQKFFPNIVNTDSESLPANINSCPREPDLQWIEDKVTKYPTLQGANGKTIDFAGDIAKLGEDWKHPHYPIKKLSAFQQQWWDSLQEKFPGPPCFRREYRRLSDSKRKSLHDAFNAMRSTYPGGEDMSEYDIFILMHQKSNAPTAHFTPVFLPWHREYIIRFENALRSHYPTVCLAYFSSPMDQPLPDPSHSLMWTEEFFGNPNGPVTTGFAAEWKAFEGCEWLGEDLTRNVKTGASGQVLLFSGADIAYVMAQKGFDNISCPNHCKYPEDHAFVHYFIGNHMAYIACAPIEPVFFLHHTYVDCVWEEFRTQIPYTGPMSPDLDYPDIYDEQQGPNDPMLPFNGMKNIDGCSMRYTPTYYKCDDISLTCDPTDPDPCGSPYFWCEPEMCRCRGKVASEGNCTGLIDDACSCTGGLIPKCTSDTCECMK